MSRFQLEVRMMKKLDVKESELLTLTAAAGRLGLSPSAVSDLVLRGALRRVVDGDEPNPTKANRVFAVDVDSEVARRRARRKDGGDERLRGRV